MAKGMSSGVGLSLGLVLALFGFVVWGAIGLDTSLSPATAETKAQIAALAKQQLDLESEALLPIGVAFRSLLLGLYLMIAAYQVAVVALVLLLAR